jgi:hypothetical protein
VALRKFFVYGLIFSMIGSTPTFRFEYGTGAACASPVVLTGAFQADITPAIGHYMHGDAEMTILGIYVVTTGPPTLEGLVSYIPQ